MQEGGGAESHSVYFRGVLESNFLNCYYPMSFKKFFAIMKEYTLVTNLDSPEEVH